MDDNAKELCRRGDRLFSARDTLHDFWQEIAELYHPTSANFTQELSWGRDFLSTNMESSPILFHRDLSNALSAMLRPRGSPWFKQDIDDARIRKEKDVAEWFESRTEIQRRWMYKPKAQFVRAAKEGDHSITAFGNAVLSVEVNERQDGLLYQSHHLKNCAWVDNKDGETDTMFRDFWLSARNIKKQWPKATLHRDITKACDKEPDKEFKIRHIMLPAEDYEYHTRKGKPRGPKFVSIYVDWAHQQIISELPSWEFRYVVERWQSVTGSQYAYSPAVIAGTPDSRGLQIMMRVLLEAGEKAVDPPVRAKKDQIIGQVNLQASGITWIDGEYDESKGGALEPIELNAKNLAVGAELLDRTREALKEAWYLNKLTLPQQGAKTAFETAQLVEEYIRSSIPLFEPMEVNNAAILDMTAAILFRVGAFGPVEEMPEALRGREMTWGFSNPLQEAIEKNKVMQFLTVAGQLMPTAMTADPTVKQHFNTVEAFRDAVAGSGAPASWLENRKTADANVEQEQQTQAAAQAVQGIGMAGKSAEQVGKAGVVLKDLAA